VRTPAYRVGMILGGGVLISVAGVVGWPWAWRAAGGLCAVLLAATWFVPSVPRLPAAGFPLVEPVRRLIARGGPGAFVEFATFVLLFKIGDYAMAPLTKVFQVDAGLGDAEIGVLGTMGIGATVLGGILGAVATTRMGLFRALWVLGLLQAASNLLYAAAAAWPSWLGLRAAVLVEPFCAGLGTAPFLALLMTSCDREHSGTQFALLTALFGVGRWLAGRWSGDAAAAMGYAPWFALTFLLALPAFLFLPHLRRRLQFTSVSDTIHH
jgi:PAT family beta-lactamase induction signal transducer AmpG